MMFGMIKVTLKTRFMRRRILNQGFRFFGSCFQMMLEVLFCFLFSNAELAIIDRSEPVGALKLN